VVGYIEEVEYELKIFLSYVDGIAIESGGKGALVGNISGDLTLILSLSFVDVTGVVQGSVLGSVTSGLQSSEQSLFSTQDLDSGSRALGKVGKRTSLKDQFSTNLWGKIREMCK